MEPDQHGIPDDPDTFVVRCCWCGGSSRSCQITASVRCPIRDCSWNGTDRLTPSFETSAVRRFFASCSHQGIIGRETQPTEIDSRPPHGQPHLHETNEPYASDKVPTSKHLIPDQRLNVKYLAPALRTAVALLGLTAIVSTFFDTATRATINPFNFFGFFTMQSNILLVVVLLVSAVVFFSGRRQSNGLVLARGCATTYIVITGVVYNLLLAGQAGGVTLAWANTTLHVILPLYAALDWVIFSDRSALPWNKLWVALIYPVVWIIVVLIRGATDGWVPYPFLNPAQGYGVVALYAVAIAVAAVVFASLVWAASRLNLVRSPSARVTAA